MKAEIGEKDQQVERMTRDSKVYAFVCQGDGLRERERQ